MTLKACPVCDEPVPDAVPICPICGYGQRDLGEDAPNQSSAPRTGVVRAVHQVLWLAALCCGLTGFALSARSCETTDSGHRHAVGDAFAIVLVIAPYAVARAWDEVTGDNR